MTCVWVAREVKVGYRQRQKEGCDSSEGFPAGSRRRRPVRSSVFGSRLGTGSFTKDAINTSWMSGGKKHGSKSSNDSPEQ